MLQNCLPQNVRRVLRELPKSLDETYERVLKGIGAANQRQAHRLLQCLTVAARPLRVEELAEVLALDFDGAKDGIPVLNKDWRWDDRKEGVLSTCSSLIIIATLDVVDDDLDSISGCRVVQFAHFSVKEFLISGRLADQKTDISHFHISLEPAHTIIAQACLGVLLQLDNRNIDIDIVNDSFPLARYAAQYWVVHARFESVSFRVQVGLFDPTKPYFAVWLKSYNIDCRWWSFLPDLFQFHRDAQDHASLCLYYASFCGFRDLTKHLIAKYPQHVNARVGLNQCPLGAALCNSHFQVAEVLHQHGANPDVIVNLGGCTLLYAASMDGNTDVVRFLLSIGANADAGDDDCITPLHLAVKRGDLELVRTLLRHGVDADAADMNNRTPLHEASARGHVAIVRLLVQHGADASKDLQRLLLLASSSASTETVQFFIRFGAYVNTRDENHLTPLHRASSVSDNAETVRLLIKHNADVHAQDQGNKTPLHLASSSSRNDETVQVLIEHGADVHARDQSHSTPLHSAVSPWSNANNVRLLIKHGADINAQNETHMTPLHLASFSGENDGVVQLLIEHGANVHARDKEQSTPLHLASLQPSNSKNVQLLIDHGADVNAQNNRDSTPLHLALFNPRNAETVQLLLEHGADVHARDQKHSTPLHLASSYQGNDETVHMILIKHGADIHARDQCFSTPLHLASSSVGGVETVRLLIGHGADVHARDQNHKTPLHLASYRGDAKIMKLLIEYGADIHAQDQFHKTPLDLVSWHHRPDDETVRLFLEHEADCPICRTHEQCVSRGWDQTVSGFGSVGESIRDRAPRNS